MLALTVTDRVWSRTCRTGVIGPPPVLTPSSDVFVMLVLWLLGGGKPLHDDLVIYKLFGKLRARWSPSCWLRSLRCRSVGEPVCELLAAKKVVCEIKSGRRTDDGKVKQRERFLSSLYANKTLRVSAV